MSKLSWVAALAMTATLVACGGGSDAPPQVAAADTTLSIAPANGPAIANALANVPFTFPTGVPALGTTAATTLNISSASATVTPAFTLTSTEGTASGALQFGSCVFVIANSSFPAGHQLAAGNTVTVNPCQVRLGTQGAPADSVARSRAAVFILGSAASTGSNVTITINAGGQVTINGQAAGSVTLVPVSGG